MKTDGCVLFSGAANGAESEFGAAAERRSIDEVNYTFEACSTVETSRVPPSPHNSTAYR